ncbi:hypothetical protein D9M72_543300 [compost metagenome]
MFLGGRIRLRQGLHIGFDIKHVLRLHPAIGCIGHDWIEIVAVAVESDHHRIEKLGVAPPADTVGMVRDVRRIEGSDRRVHLHAAGQKLGFIARSVAGAAAGCVEHVFAVLDIRLVGREGVLGKSVARRCGAGTERGDQQTGNQRQSVPLADAGT